MNRKKFNDDFKKMIVDLYHSGTSVKDLCGEYGVSEVTVYRWIKQFTPVGSGDESITQKEMVEMKKEMLRLQQENEILKKAMAIFAKK
ncbi:transposase [Caldalkalibacillus thermarum]|nr:transposase [Caldalkalibacillus thermarum]